MEIAVDEAALVVVVTEEGEEDFQEVVAEEVEVIAEADVVEAEAHLEEDVAHQEVVVVLEEQEEAQKP